jgi:tyrosyl-tRNA synthetase
MQFGSFRSFETSKLENNKNFCPICKENRPFDKKDIIAPKPVYLHEFLYPLMQGYDSVAMDVDMEVGGNDQTFNMLAGRDLMKNLKQKEKFVLTTKLLVDPTGKKMGKTEGNMVTLEDTPEDMYGKVMSWPDTLMPVAFEICTRVPLDEVKNILAGNPRDAKMRLAREIVSLYQSPDKAKTAEDNFIKIFQKKETPEEVAEVKIKNEKNNILELLVETKLAASKGEARRLVEQGGVKVGDKIIKDINAVVEISEEGVLIQKGKRYFVKARL